MRHPRVLGLIVVIGLMALVLSSCQTVSEMPLIKAEKKPEYRLADCQVGVPTPLLKVSVLHPPLTFNPVTAMDDVSRLVSAQITATLYRYDPDHDTFGPSLATGYDRGPKNQVFIIHLRRNITFSDGTPFTARDVLATISYIRRPEVITPLRSYLSFAGHPLEFSLLDDSTIRCMCAEPLDAIEPVLAKIPVLPAAVIEDAVQQNRLRNLYDPTNTSESIPSIGPYVISLFSPGEKKLTLARNPNYWVVDAVGRRLPYIEEVVFNFAATTAGISMSFRTGESDVIDHIDPADAARLANVRGMKIFDTGASCSTVAVWFNQSMKTDPRTKETFIEPYRLRWFNDDVFRRVASAVINRAIVTEEIYQGKAVVTGSLLSPQEAKWYRDLKVDTITDARAQQELRDVGYRLNRSVSPAILYGPNQVPVQFSISVLSGDSFSEKLGARLERDFGALGIKATMVALPYDLYFRKVFGDQPDYHLAVMTLNQPRQPYFLKEIVDSTSCAHYWYPEEAAPASEGEMQMDADLTRLYGSSDWTTKYDAVHDLQQIMLQNNYIIPVVKPDGLFGAKGKVHNLRVSFRCATLLWNLEELYILEE